MRLCLEEPLLERASGRSELARLPDWSVNAVTSCHVIALHSKAMGKTRYAHSQNEKIGNESWSNVAEPAPVKLEREQSTKESVVS